MNKKLIAIGITLIILVLMISGTVIIVKLAERNPSAQTNSTNPAINMLATARDSQRQSAVNEILSAITQYVADDNTVGSLGDIPTCPTIKYIGTGEGYINLGDKLIPTYISLMPIDPLSGTSINTGYAICQSLGKITISAPLAESDRTIKVTY